MATITIDGKEYDLDDLNNNAKEQVASLTFAQNEIKRLEAQIAITRTAAAAYSNALKSELDN